MGWMLAGRAAELITFNFSQYCNWFIVTILSFTRPPMSKQSKALAKLSASPPPSGLKWDELKAVLEHLGYKMLKGSGSRRKFYHKEKDLLVICHEPHPSPDVDKGCIASVVDHLKTNGFI